MNSKESAIKRACRDNNYTWPDKLESGVMFYEGHRITIQEFYAWATGFRAQPVAQPPEGKIVVTKNEQGQIVAVTRQDHDRKVLEVIAEAQPSAQAPSGYKLVPIEPTPAMLDIAQSKGFFRQHAAICYRAMLSVAPQGE